MNGAHRVFRARRVVTPEGVRAAALHVVAGVIAAVTDYDDTGDAPEIVDAGDAMLLPGLVDTHVHSNDPGRTEWEGFETATRAAAAGGVTTIVDMPLNSVPATTTADALAVKVAAAEGRCLVDVAFWGGLVPDNVAELRALADAGVRGFKCFLVPSGVPDFDAVDEPELRRALPLIAELGLPLLVHAELPAFIDAATPTAGDPRTYARYLASRPAAAETGAVELLIALARDSGAWIHIVHVSAAETLPLLRNARAQGVRITAETCPHYLHFASEQVPDGATEFKCAPPIRGADHRERLWTGLANSDLDLIASDHSPCTPALKQRETGAFDRAWGGIASLQLGLSVVWTGAQRRGIDITRVADWMASSPARLAGLHGRKGAIATGYDADLVVFEPATAWTVDAARLYHRHAVTPYAGEQLNGVVRATVLRGETIYDAGAIIGPPHGRLLTREGAPWISRS